MKSIFLKDTLQLIVLTQMKADVENVGFWSEIMAKEAQIYFHNDLRIQVLKLHHHVKLLG